MKNRFVPHDERTISVENASYRVAYSVMSFGLLVSVIYRSLVLGDSAWDLLALAVLGGVVATFYQGSHQILNRRWAFVTLATALIAAVIAVFVVLAIAFFRR